MPLATANMFKTGFFIAGIIIKGGTGFAEGAGLEVLEVYELDEEEPELKDELEKELCEEELCEEELFEEELFEEELFEEELCEEELCEEELCEEELWDEENGFSVGCGGEYICEGGV
jgi:hypothetical protein